MVINETPFRSHRSPRLGNSSLQKRSLPQRERERSADVPFCWTAECYLVRSGAVPSFGIHLKVIGTKTGSLANAITDHANPDQFDLDGDGVGDACDHFLTTTNQNQGDKDNDRVGDRCDNCRGIANQSYPNRYGYCRLVTCATIVLWLPTLIKSTAMVTVMASAMRELTFGGPACRSNRYGW